MRRWYQDETARSWRDESEDEKIEHIKNLLVVDGRTFGYKEPASGGHLKSLLVADI